MNEKEKELKAFNQCADALNSLDKKSIYKVFQLLSIHFDFVANNNTSSNNNEAPSSEVAWVIAWITTEQNTTQHTVTIKKTQASSTKKSKSSSSKWATMLADFNFHPSGKISLKDFYQKYKTKSNLEKNLIFAYYLQEELQEPNISMNHIFSCYRHLNIKLPSFPQTLVDTKAAKSRIETADMANLRITTVGINFLEHEMPKNNDQ